MTEKITILIVDDSTIIRHVLKNTLAPFPELEVVSTAASAKIALNKIRLYSPDLILLDIDMPEMNGLELLDILVKDFPATKVIMCSSYSEHSARTTFDCLSIGADDFITKPSSMIKQISDAEETQTFGDLLRDKISALFVNVPPAVETRALKPTQAPVSRQIEAVAIGISTGGPDALLKVIPELPANLAVPVLIVQHMPAMFTRLLAERIQSKSAIRVCEAQDRQAVLPGCVYIAPGDYHMTIISEKGKRLIQLSKKAPINYCRPCVDLLFESMAELYQQNMMALIMTGMGQDGLEGCKKINQQGGLIYAQDKESSTVWGMPGAVVNAGLSTKNLSLNEIPGEIMRVLAKHNELTREKRAG